MRRSRRNLPLSANLTRFTNDGQGFLVAASAGSEKTVPMTVVLNWYRSILPQSR
jgi:hypothetical protein